MRKSDFGLYQIIRRNAHCFPDRMCWAESIGKRQTTFSDFKNDVDCLASGLCSGGLKKGDRIAVIGRNSLEMFLIFGAAAAVGAVVVPINWRLSITEIDYILRDSAPTVIVSGEEHRELVLNGISGISSVKTCFGLCKEADELYPLPPLPKGSPNANISEVEDKDAFVIIYTAAVDGKPKGAVLSQRNMLCAILHLHLALRISKADANLNMLPLYHILGLSAALATFHAGGKNVNLPNFDPHVAVEAIVAHQISLLFEYAPMLKSILDASEEALTNISCVRAVLGLDDHATIERFKAMTAGDFFVAYGQTEVSGFATIGNYYDRPGACGEVVSLGEVVVTDENDNRLRTGKIGEILCRGPIVFNGYWRLNLENDNILRNGWHHTGDVGYFDEDGFLWYVGRQSEKALIKTGGENVYPIEVEKVLLEHPGIKDVCVIGVPDPKWKEGIKAVCVLGKGAEVKAEDLVEFVGDRIARYKKPQYVEFVDELPLTEGGDVDRERVRKVYGAQAT